MTPIKFSDKDIETLISLWNDNLTVKEIAIAMERPFNNVRNKIKALQDKGAITPRAKSNELDRDSVAQLAGAYQLPIDTVAYLAGLFSGGATRILANLQQACEAYINQNGYCYYLHGRVKLTMDDSPSGAFAMHGPEGTMILVCNAVANTRKTMTHEGFVGLCKLVAQRFA